MKEEYKDVELEIVFVNMQDVLTASPEGELEPTPKYETEPGTVI